MAASDEDNNQLPHQDSDDSSDDELLQGKASDSDDDDIDDDEITLEENPNDLPSVHDNFIILKQADIHQRIQEHIAQVSAVLSLSKVEASILLLHYNWSVNKVHDAWFADEIQVREKTGLLLKPLIELSDDPDDVMSCGICFDFYDRDGIRFASCGHPYCNDCWSSYIKTAIDNGPGSLLLKCPEPSCSAAVGEDLVGLFLSNEEKIKYSKYVVMSYIEANKMMKWCPGPDCENAIKFVAGSEHFDVSCLCSHSFCWNCTQEPHRPVDCETVKKWMTKNNLEAENMNYILAFTKPCPKCKRPIEKNMGCNHMTCRPPCSHHFCWLCLGDWAHHYNCNRYQADGEEERREKARSYAMRYTHYFERWATNKKSMKKAASDLQIVQNKQIEIIGRIQAQTEVQLSFITEAWKQIVECRRVLTWTYAFGYYLPDEDPAKRNLFEYLQGQAESDLERLHDCAEKELAPFLEFQQETKEFIEFRKKLTSLTKVTRNYFENLVTALQNGLSDVNSQTCSGPVLKKPRLNSSHHLTMSTAAAVTGTQGLYPNINLNYAIAEPNGWICSYCTYANHNSVISCTMCGRGSWTCSYCTFANLRTSPRCAMCSVPRLP